MNRQKIGIIGAGPAGISQLIELNNDQNINKNFEIICYEKQNKIGGQWNYLSTYSSMYDNMLINCDKQYNEFYDYKFEDHFKNYTNKNDILNTKYISCNLMVEYIMGRCNKYNIHNLIKLNHEILNVTYNEATKKIKIQIYDIVGCNNIDEYVDYLIIANGDYSIPYYPKNILNMTKCFSGLVIHSHNFKYISDYVNKNILLIGNGDSSKDIAYILYKNNAKNIFISYRNSPMISKLSNNIYQKPLIQNISDKTIYFIDESSIKVDIIIFCTEYIKDDSFIEESLKIKNNSLNNNISYIGNNNIFYIGNNVKINEEYSFCRFDIEAIIIKNVILNLLIPFKNINKLTSTNYEFKTNKEYMIFLLSLIDNKIYDINILDDILQKCKIDQNNNILTYRNNSFILEFNNLSLDEQIKTLHLVDINLLQQFKDNNPKIIIIDDNKLPNNLIINNINNSRSLISKQQFKKNTDIFINEMLYIDLDNIILMKINNEYTIIDNEHTCNKKTYREFYYFDSFMNHSCDPNTELIYLYEKKYKMIAIKDIQEGDELTCDYSLFDDNNDYEPFECKCGSYNCKKMI